jgi:hypothetical protein
MEKDAAYNKTIFAGGKMTKIAYFYKKTYPRTPFPRAFSVPEK